MEIMHIKLLTFKKQAESISEQTGLKIDDYFLEDSRITAVDKALNDSINISNLTLFAKYREIM
ncbi:hypothetical protein EWB00_009682 [Schistosoma japonicum]|uniref:Uncharacterized protein n=1 Tax=Schistosoma japonicum TaxID=6182 RepID=A0A4Z2CLL4_SCHJA|nr:hypothetical protein EWB00_009682 [Schistosoma japonicum]